MNPRDSIKNVLYIDLTKRSFKVVDRSDLFSKRPGGTGVAIKLLQEECGENCDPFSPDNPIILTVGVLNGLFPLASKTVAMFKSPHTGNLGESHAGGRSSIAIRLAGLGAIVIKGKSEIPVYLAIYGHKVYFRDARTLWGMRSAFTPARAIRSREKGSGYRTILSIGRAGENLITYASVTAETYRHFGRLGLGAVFGSKKLKAIMITGKGSIPIEDRKYYREIYKKIYDSAVNSELMKKYHDLGTPENVLPLNSINGLPTKNLLKTTHEFAEELSGENLAKNYLGRRLACAHCPVGCIHLAALREPYEDEPYFYKTKMIPYDYEPIFSLATMLELKSAEDFLNLMDKVENSGMDVMSTGLTLSWATEAMEKGLITEKETEGLKFKWGDAKTYINAIEKIVKRTNDFYRALGNGAEHASKIYGGKEFALTNGGNEMPGYHTGPAAHAGFLTGARHSHLDSAGYSIDQKILVKEKLSPKELAQKLISEERWRQILSSLVICFFARNIYNPETVVEALNSAGYSFTKEELFELGKEILKEKYEFKYKSGFSLKTIRIPKRILETESSLGKISEEFLRETILEYEKFLEIE